MARTFEFNKESTALVVVDLQNDFVRQDAPLLIKEALGTLPANKKLIDFARKNNMPVIFTKFVTGNKPTLIWNWSTEIPEHKCCKRGHMRYYPDVDATLQCSDIVDELKPIMPEDYVIEKYNYSSFHNTSLTDILHSEGADTIIVTGTVTQICVLDTVHAGFAQGFKVILVSDCISTWDPLQQRATEESTARKYGMVMTSEELLQRLG